MTWLNNLILKLTDHINQSKKTSDNEQNLTNLDIFQYYAGGVIISYNDLISKANWEDISQIAVSKRDLFIVDRIEMQITCRNQLLRINEDLPGWQEFVLKMKEVFPAIPQQWDSEIFSPPFIENFTIIYTKS